MMIAAFGVIRLSVVDVIASLLVGRILPIVPENSAEAKNPAGIFIRVATLNEVACRVTILHVTTLPTLTSTN